MTERRKTGAKPKAKGKKAAPKRGRPIGSTTKPPAPKKLKPIERPTAGDIDMIHTMTRAGTSREDMAEALKVTPRTLYRWLAAIRGAETDKAAGETIVEKSLERKRKRDEADEARKLKLARIAEQAAEAAKEGESAIDDEDDADDPEDDDNWDEGPPPHRQRSGGMTPGQQNEVKSFRDYINDYTGDARTAAGQGIQMMLAVMEGLMPKAIANDEGAARSFAELGKTLRGMVHEAAILSGLIPAPGMKVVMGQNVNMGTVANFPGMGPPQMAPYPVGGQVPGMVPGAPALPAPQYTAPAEGSETLADTPESRQALQQMLGAAPGELEAIERRMQRVAFAITHEQDQG